MGFSVSASTAIVFIAAIVSFGMLYTSAYNGFEAVQEATVNQQEAALERANTDLVVTNVTHETVNGTEYVNVSVRNSGASALHVNATDVLISGEYVSSYASRKIDTGSGTVVAGAGGTNLWLPDETLVVSVSIDVTEPFSVKVVSGPGVAVTEEVP